MQVEQEEVKVILQMSHTHTHMNVCMYIHAAAVCKYIYE